MSCSYVVDVKGIASMKGCTLTESKTEVTTQKKKHYQLCPPTCYEGDYSQCPIYRVRAKHVS